MFPPGRPERGPMAACIYQNCFSAGRDGADFGNAYACDNFGHASLPRGGKKKLIILASMEREFHLHCIPVQGGARDRFFPDLRAYVALLAKVVEVGRQTVAEIDHGGC